MSRKRLPDRRLCKTVSYESDGHNFRLAAGYHSDGTVGEAFLNTGKTNSTLDALASDAAILISLALQFGCPLSVLQHAIKRDGKGRASSLIGTALDQIAVLS